MKIKIYNRQRQTAINKVYYTRLVEKFVYSRIENKQITNRELYISFVSISRIIQLNRILFSKSQPTDVISVPINTDNAGYDLTAPCIFGEIFICAEVAKKQSREFKTGIRKELALLLAHGLLHLIGYKDDTVENKRVMRREEKKILRSTGIN
ncbi:MAG: rRNA maturation RNase YbeY [Elusimicrobiota bacterium]